MALYATADDLAAFGLPASVLATIPEPQQLAAIESASLLADDYLRSRVTVPLTEWGVALTEAVCTIAAYNLLRVIGFNPDGPDALVVEAYREARAYLEKVAQGKLATPVAVDATPSVYEGGPVVDSDEPRGW